MQKDHKENEEILRGDGSFNLDCGDDFIAVYMSNFSNYMLEMCAVCCMSIIP